MSPKCRLFITLRFLAAGDSFKSLHYNNRVGLSTARNIVYETCEALWVVLAQVFMKYPSEEEWIQIAADFQDKLRFPNCVGAVDGKHIEINAPKNSGSMYFNYLKYSSIVLLAVCDANKSFIYVDIDVYGSQSDGGVLFHSTFGERLDKHRLDMPSPIALPRTDCDFPFFIVSDSAFPLNEHIQTPYPDKYLDLSEIQVNYNKEHSSVRKVAENASAILVQRWQILKGPIDADPDNVDRIVKATVVLHNFIKSFQDEASVRYMREENGRMSTDSGLRNFNTDGLVVSSHSTTRNAHIARDIYASYLFYVN